jgi:hypothetical protein
VTFAAGGERKLAGGHGRGAASSGTSIALQTFSTPVGVATMNNIIYIVGLVVVVLAVLYFFGLA